MKKLHILAMSACLSLASGAAIAQSSPGATGTMDPRSSRPEGVPDDMKKPVPPPAGTGTSTPSNLDPRTGRPEGLPDDMKKSPPGTSTPGASPSTLDPRTGRPEGVPDNLKK